MSIEIRGTSGNMADVTPAAALKVDGSAASPSADLTTKGTQKTNFLSTQDAKDSGRAYVTLLLDRVAGVTAETLDPNLTVSKGGTVIPPRGFTTSYTVTAGKTFRIQAVVATILTTSGSTAPVNGVVRVRSASIVSTTASILVNADIGSPIAATASPGQGVGSQLSVPVPDGLEIAGGQQIGVSHFENSAACTVSVFVIGYEY